MLQPQEINWCCFGLDLLQLIIAAILLLFVWRLWICQRRWWKNHSPEKWYDLRGSNSSDEVQWCSIRRVIMLDYDPLIFQKQETCKAGFKRWIGLLVFLCYIIFLITLVLNIYPDQFKALVKINGAWAILAIVPTAIGVFFQIRVNARAEKRQQWINSIRDLMHKLISRIPNYNKPTCEKTSACSRHNAHFTHLKLYLNPSEKIHRSFLYAIAVIYDCPSWRTGFPDCEEMLKLNPPTSSDEHEKLVEGISLLASILLKREWEQIKQLS